MAVRATSSDADNVTVWHEEAGHAGVLAWAAVTYGQRFDGTPDPAWIVLSCPVAGCDAHTLHPESAGASDPAIAELFAQFATRQAAADTNKGGRP